MSAKLQKADQVRWPLLARLRPSGVGQSTAALPGYFRRGFCHIVAAEGIETTNSRDAREGRMLPLTSSGPMR